MLYNYNISYVVAFLGIYMLSETKNNVLVNCYNSAVDLFHYLQSQK
jgi:hypothetical protein